MKPIELPSFTKVIAELSLLIGLLFLHLYIQNHLKYSNPSLDSFLQTCKKHNMDCFTSLNVESLQLCTEGLGFESSDEVEEPKDERRDDWRNHEKADAIKHSLVNHDRNLRNCTDVNGTSSGFKRSKLVSNFPPPISSIGSRGKPCFIFRSYRHDGRFVLREIKIPNNEILHASRENGRLTLHLVPSIEEMTEEKEDANEEEEEEEAAAEEEEMKSAGKPEICDG